MRVLLWFALAQVCLAGRPYHVEHYDVLVKPDLAAKRIDGEVTVKLRSLVDKLDTVVLDSGGLTIDEVAEDKFGLGHLAANKQLSITLKKPAAKGEIRSIRIKYHGTPTRGIRRPFTASLAHREDKNELEAGSRSCIGPWGQPRLLS